MKAQPKAIDLVFSPSPDCPDWVQGDSNRFRQILFNIVGNAIKFTERGFVLVNCQSLGLGEDDRYQLEILVSDSGIGMTESEIERLFQPFSQADVSTTRRFGGSGLGLNLSRRMARKLGGELTLKASLPGKGSCFRLTLPLAPGSRPEDLPSLPVEGIFPENAGLPLLTGLDILVVEDAKDIQFLLQQYLAEAGAQPWIANDGIEAMEAVAKRSYDLVLMDIQMPRQDGFTTSSLMREAGLTMPIVALTAHAMQEDKVRSINVGCNELLTKPFNPEALVKTIKQFTAGRKTSS